MNMVTTSLASSASRNSRSSHPSRAAVKPASVPPGERSASRKVAVKAAPTTKNEGEGAPRRVRLKPETRDQLLERLRNPQLSLHEASILLRVSRATVRRYADAGRLPCERTPGGQRRFFLRDIENFYRQLKAKK